MNLFDRNGMDPNLPQATARPLVVWEFDPPAGDTLRVHLDVSTDSTAAFKDRAATTSVIEDNRALAMTNYRTRVLP